MSNSLDGSDSAITSGIGTAIQSVTVTAIPDNANDSNVINNFSSNSILVDANSTDASEHSLGFCHSCNKQTQINLQAFTCTECRGGFIELNSTTSPSGPSATAASMDIPTGNSNASNLSSGIRPIDRLIDSRPIEISDDDEETTGNSNNPSPFFVLNSDEHSTHSNGSLTGGATNTQQGDSFSTVTTPLFQLIRRLNNRRARVANIINSQLQHQQTLASELSSNGSLNADVSGSTTQTADQTRTAEITLDGDSDASSDWPPPSSNQTLLNPNSHRDMTDAINTGVIFNPFNSFNRARTSSFHYRLRRHGANSGPSGLISSRESAQESRRIPIHRHRFHRSPQASRFHFNFLDDDELLNDHGAIIITTLINQLRNTNRGAAPASDVQIKNLPTVEMDKEQIDKISQCAVCMEDFALLEKVKQLPCKHLYHDPCIDQWLKLHATCPICRKNISEDDPPTDGGLPDAPTLESTRPTLLNIFPFSGSGSSLDSYNLGSNISRSQSTDSHISAAQSALNNPSSGRQTIRNRQLYRVQIRQATAQPGTITAQDNNLSSSSSSSIASSNGNSDSATLTDEPALQRAWFDRVNLRRNRMYDTFASTMSVQERQPGVRATAVLINPRWNRSTTQTTNIAGESSTTESPTDTAATDASNTATTGTTEPGSMSAFSLMSDYRNYRSSQSPAGAISSGSRISQMVDRLLNHYRTTRFSNGTGHRSSPYGSMDASNPAQRFSLHSRSINTRNPSPQRTQDSGTGPSISLRLGQLFRSNRHRTVNLAANSDSNSSNSQSNEPPTGTSATTTTSSTGTTNGEAATAGNTSSSDFFEIIQLEPSSLDDGLERTSFGPGNRTSLRLPSSQRLLRREGQSQGPLDDNDSFTENPNNYFDFSLFNRSQTLENNLLLDRLFDIPEDAQQITSDELDDHILGLADEEDDEDRDESNDDDDDVPELISADDDEPITITLDGSDFERHQYAPSGPSREQTRRLSDMEDGSSAAVVSQAKKRKTESA